MKKANAVRALMVVLSWFALGRLAAAEPLFTPGTLPTNNLDYPALIKLPNMTGSGFFVNDSAHWYLVTARHIFFKDTLVKNAHGDTARVYKLLSTRATVSGYTAGQRYELEVNLDALSSDGFLKADTLHDIAVACLGRCAYDSTGVTTYSDPRHVRFTGGQQAAPILAWWRILRTYEQVIVGNDVFIFGYPISIGLRRATPKEAQIDYDRPLVHKGIVAGLNPAKRTIVIDVAAYPGNSGGPVIGVEETPDAGVTKYVPIGVVIEYVPFEDDWVNSTRGYWYSTITSSDYSVVEPLDPVINIIRSWQGHP